MGHRFLLLCLLAVTAAGGSAWAASTEEEVGGVITGGGLVLPPAPKAPAPPEPKVDTTPSFPIEVNQPLTVDGYIGMVNGEPMFVDGVLRPIDAELKRIARIVRDLGEFRAAARDTITKQINVMISDMLIVKAAKDVLSEDDNKRVDAYMNKTTKDLLTKYEGSAAKADLDLRAQGSSMDKDLAEKKRRFIVELYLHRVLWPKIVVIRKSVLDEYQRNLDKYTLPAEVDLYTITIPVAKFLPKESGPRDTMVPVTHPTSEQVKEATSKAVAEARKLIAQIKAGEEFATLAELNSADPKSKNGGRWPHTRQGMLALLEIEKAAFALPENSIAEPVVVFNDDAFKCAVVVVKVGKVQAASIVDFTKAQDEIERKLREVQYVTLTGEYYRKLREKAAIEGVDRMVDMVTDAALVRYLAK